jgi:5-deoxy-D-glucuronate isomerase
MLGDISSYPPVMHPLVMHPPITYLPVTYFPNTYPPVMAGLDPAIRSGTSLRKVADGVTGHDGWVSTNGRWH